MVTVLLPLVSLKLETAEAEATIPSTLTPTKKFFNAFIQLFISELCAIFIHNTQSVFKTLINNALHHNTEIGLNPNSDVSVNNSDK